LARRSRLQRLWTPARRSLGFNIGQSGQQLMIQPGVLATFEHNRQLRPRDNEAGGQLFGRIIENNLSVELATGPRPTDIRMRFSYKPDRRAEQTEIDRYHREGLLFLGDWHTHPEPHPSPSPQDLRSICAAFKESTHHLNGLLLVIVGTQESPSGPYVAVHNDKENVRLVPRELGVSTPQPSTENTS
jgi:integrative and conjugative element protein (TIGR02256 family)